MRLICELDMLGNGKQLQAFFPTRDSMHTDNKRNHR